MDVQSLRYYVEVVRQGGFTRASKTLHVTQPALSKSVKALEEELGTALLVRERRRVRPTDAGKIVLERARVVIDALRVLEDEVVELSALRRGRLRVGMPPITGVAFFAPLLAEYHQLYPGILLELREEGSRNLESLVRGRDLDVGAVVLPTDEGTFATSLIVRDALRAVVHPSHPLARRREVKLRELQRTPFVLYRPEFALHGHILEACRQVGFVPTVVSESSHWDFIVAMVAANIGLALLPDTICRQLDRRQVRTLRLTDPVIPWNAALIWRKDQALPPATRAFIDLARKRWGNGLAPASLGRIKPAAGPRVA